MTCLTRRFCFSLILTGTIAVCISGTAQGQTSDAKSKGTGSVSGRVTVGDKPAPGILITVAGNQATSDADGRYHVGGLTAGQIMVIPAAPLYVIPDSPMYGPGKVINLSAGETVDGVDFKLARGGVITGRVKDAEGRPVIEERISLTALDENGAFSRQESFSRFSNDQMHQTDDRGIYRIYGVPAGHYKVSAGNEAGSTAGLRTAGYYQKTYYPDATDPAKAVVVDLSEGGEAKDIDINLGRRAVVYSVSGRIIDSDTGKPSPGIPFAIGVVEKNQNQNYIAGSASPGAPTNSQGEFRLEGIEPGHYGVFVSTDRFGLISNGNAGTNVYSDPVVFEVIDGDITNLEVKAQRGLSVAGVVVPDGITDKKALARLSGLRFAANVTPVISTGARVLAGVGASSVVGPDGSFQIDGLRPGKVNLGLVAGNGSDPKGFTITRIEHKGALQNRGIDLQPGENATGVKIFLSYGTGAVRGQVKVEGGTLPSDAIIFVALMRDGIFDRGSGQVDSRRRFLIQNLAPGTYEVVLQVMSLGGSNSIVTGVPRQQKQSVTVTDGVETEIFFTLNLQKDGQ